MIATAGALLMVMSAQTYRLSGDTLVLSRVPAGVIALGGEATAGSWASAEALIWGGAGADPEANALVAAIRLRHPDGWVDLSAGRMIVAGGALRPIHLDGGKVVLRAPFGTSVEAFGGVPVGPELTGRGGDWGAGARVAQNVLGYGVVGLSVFQQNDAGDLAHREIGVDAAITPADWLDLSARGAYDLLDDGVSEILVGGGVTFGPVRAELFGSRREPSRLLPATSVFSVLGNIPSTRGGARIVVRAAPRLDVSVLGGVREVDGVGEEIAARATLRLDDRGAGMVALELRRDGTPGAGWYGVRAVARVPFLDVLVAATELELVVPDASERGSLWPWGILSLSWRPATGWEVGAAVEGSATPALEAAVDGLFRAAYRWGSE